MKINNWKTLFAPQILARGKAYYEEGTVESLDIEDDEITAEVYGSELYEVTVWLDGNEVEDMDCTCPYAEDGSACKHEAAVLFELEEEGYPDRPANSVPGKDTESVSLADAVAHLSASAAKELLLEEARGNQELRERIIRRVTGAIPADQVRRWMKEISRIIASYSDRYGYIDYESAYDCTCELSVLIEEKVPLLLEAGMPMEAFELINAVFEEAYHTEMDDDGGLSELFSCCKESWITALQKADPSQRQRMYEWFKTQFIDEDWDYAGDYIDDMLFDYDWGPDIAHDALRLLDEKIGSLEHIERNCSLEYYVRRRISLMEQMDSDPADAEAFLKKHRVLPSVRKYLVQREISAGNINRAMDLLIESKELDQDKNGLVAEYSDQLIGLYQQAGNTDAMRRELWEYLEWFGDRDLQHTEQYKSLIPSEQWPAERDRLLALPSMQSSKAELLDREEMYPELLAWLLNDRGGYLMDRYADKLVKRYPEEIRTFYLKELRNQMNRADNRNRYRDTAARLKHLTKYIGGKTAAQELANEWKRTYDRRRAMLDELKKAGY